MRKNIFLLTMLLSSSACAESYEKKINCKFESYVENSDLMDSFKIENIILKEAVMLLLNNDFSLRKEIMGLKMLPPDREHLIKLDDLSKINFLRMADCLVGEVRVGDSIFRYEFYNEDRGLYQEGLMLQREGDIKLNMPIEIIFE